MGNIFLTTSFIIFLRCLDLQVFDTPLSSEGYITESKKPCVAINCKAMTEHFPNINLEALGKFAAETAATQYAARHAKSPVVTPRVTLMQDILWAGENMIHISFDRATIPEGPHSMLAHFPMGRPRLTTQAVIGMTAAVRRRRPDLAPEIYAYKDYKNGDTLRRPNSRTAEAAKNEIGMEVVLLEKLPGESLEIAWPRLSMAQQELVCLKLVNILLDFFYARGSHIGTDLVGTYVDTRCDQGQGLELVPRRTAPAIPGSVLMPRAFQDQPLADLKPPPAAATIEDYLKTLASRVERVFDTDPTSNAKGRDAGWLRSSPLTNQDIVKAKQTWNRLKKLTAYHKGGFYVPTHNRKEAEAILQKPLFGVYHGDMKMSRFIINISPNQTSGLSLTLATGWEHAYRAPAWSCARLPLWLSSVPFPLTQPISLERQRELRNFIHSHLNNPGLRHLAHDWIACWVFGIPERWFEGVLSAHWGIQPTVEVCISRLRSYWEAARPDVRFPLNVGSTASQPVSSREEFGGAQSLIMESVNALARASGTRPEDWGLAMRSGRFPNA